MLSHRTCMMLSYMKKENIDFHSYTNTDQLNEREWWTVNNHKTKTLIFS
jgi:hypothetical protein